MFGIDDPGIWLAYLLCLLSVGLCVGYGLWRWNRDEEAVEPADQTWARTEQKENDMEG